MTPVAPLDASGLQNWCCSALNCRSSLKQQVESLFSHCELGCEPCFNINTGMRTLALFPCMDFLSEFILQNANMQHGLDCGCISQILSNFIFRVLRKAQLFGQLTEAALVGHAALPSAWEYLCCWQSITCVLSVVQGFGLPPSEPISTLFIHRTHLSVPAVLGLGSKLKIKVKLSQNAKISRLQSETKLRLQSMYGFYLKS